MMNPSTINRYRVDYVENNNDLDAREYKYVIGKLILEIERLNAVNAVLRVRSDNN